MGWRADPLRFVCRACGRQRETRNTGNKGIYCDKKCRADYERRGRDRPFRYKQGGYWMLSWTKPGGTKHRAVKGFQFEHRAVWERACGPIPDGFVVHHANGNKLDNRIENLRLMRRGDHGRMHSRDFDQYPNGATQADYTRAWKRRHPEYRAVHAARERERRARKRASVG